MRRSFALLFLLLVALIGACTAMPAPTRELASWQPQEDALTAQDAVRAWQFSGKRGDAVRLRLDAKTGGQVTLALQDDAGRTLASGDEIELALPADGVYTAFVQLVDGAGTTYSLALSFTDRRAPTGTLTPSITPSITVTPSETPTPSNTPTLTLTPSNTPTPTPIYAPLGTLTGLLDMGATLDGSFLSQFERHIYIFRGVAGERVTLTMEPTSGAVDPVLTLFDPAGQALATDDNSGGDSAALLRDIRLPVDGDYIVQALGGAAGSYRISLSTNAPAPDQPTPTVTPPLGTTTPVAAGEQLADHVLAFGSIDRPGAFNRYFIEAEAGDILTVGVRPVDGSPLRPRLELYTPAGELMFTTGIGRDGQALIPGIGVIETGSYGVFVSDDGSAGGAYTVAYGRGSTHTDDLRGAVAAETPSPGNRLNAVRDLWILPLSAGDRLELQAFGAALQVIAPDGTIAAEGQDAVQFEAGMSGDYRAYVIGIAYTLVWRYVVAAPTSAPALLILSADAPLPAQTYLYYPFQGEAGRRVHVRVEALNAGLDPVAALLDSSGAAIAEGDDSGGSLNPDFQALLPADGTYNLRINGYGDSGGTVSVTVEMLS